ncbi:MAG TPA: serine/threonine-protein kinase [Bryobacteraceae bacterium]|nr:serine/threonine-protein kinase [Bryobacteraceae bacterium]
MEVCPQCGAELKAGDPAGLCPQCLIQGAFDSSVGADEVITQTIDRAASGDDDFGRYHILRPLGEGGMGTVYLAEQREPIRREVALKVVKLGMDTRQVLARFANERQALAMMDHPNIARIFDAGATTKGRPYFVMEYIEGVPITLYCDRNRVTVSQRLPLFLAVCRAVHHAHQKGVIHRDLKPSNVLVTEQEGVPVPKVIDFGIARATDQWAVENTLLTQFGQMVGTPEYASPEQAEVTAGTVDERSDVYSLGALLYELLIGAVPFDAARLRQAGLAEMLRIIREEEAPPLSRKLGATGAAAADIAAHRKTDPAALRRTVDGDLNSITMKALEKTRERRYASAAEMAADIERYMEHRPVLASPPSGVYRARKFVRRHRPAVFGTAAGLGLVVLSGVTVWSLAHRESAPKASLTNKSTIVLADFTNATSDPAFNGTLRQTMAGELGNSAHLTVLSDVRVSQALRLMVRPADTRLTPEVASEICERTASAAVVDGSITSLGSEYRLTLRARNCRTGDVLDEEQESLARKEDVLKALDQMANRFQSRAAEPLSRVEKEAGLPANFVDVTTPSLEAWRSYKAAWLATLRGSKSTEAISLNRRAIEIDPNFAMAYAFMGRAYDSLGEAELAAQNITKAYELRDRVSDLENFFITFNYYREAPRNLELARQTLESWVRKYPGDLMPHGFLAGLTSPGTGHFETAVEEGLKAIEIDPNYSIGYGNVAFAYLYLDRLTEAEGLLRKAAARKIDAIEFSLVRYLIAFLRNDQAAMEREVTQRQAKLQAQGFFEHQEALTMAYQGRLNEAARLSDSAIGLARQAGLRERAAQFIGARAVWSALFGIREEGRRNAAAALSILRSRDTDYGPAFALALLHDSAQSQPVQAEMEKRYPEDTFVQFSYLPALRALGALDRGDPAKALEMTHAAAPYELAVPGTAFYSGASFFGALYPVYVRGLAYSRMSRYHEAAAEFQKILDHPGITLNDPIGPMARLQLARALSASGDHAKSAAAYKDLLATWKDADPDIPVVREAKAESAKQP